jgi:hypothetical protein
MANFFAELKRRHLYRGAAGFAVAPALRIPEAIAGHLAAPFNRHT